MEDRRGAGKHGYGLRLGEESLIGNETVYSPTGTTSKWNSPSELVCMLWVNSELRALITTVMHGTGRCCGSWTMPWMLPKIVAKAPAAANRKTATTQIRCICLSQWVRVRTKCPHSGWISVRKDGPQVRRPGRRFEGEEKEAQSK